MHAGAYVWFVSCYLFPLSDFSPTYSQSKRFWDNSRNARLCDNTLAHVQFHLFTLIRPSIILLGHSLESDLRALKLSHAHCVHTASLFHHPSGRPLKPELAWLTRERFGRIIQDRGPGWHNPEEDSPACIDELQAKVKNGAFTCSSRDKIADFAGLGPVRAR